MPTDGADFGKMQACYGNAYTALRAGESDIDVAEMAVLGVEKEIRYAGGAPVFILAVELAVLISCQASSNSSQQLMRETSNLGRFHGQSSVARVILSAVERVTLKALSERVSLSKFQASKAIIELIARSSCEGMSGYATRHRTHSISTTKTLIESISETVRFAPSLSDFASRMLKAGPKGLPAKRPHAGQIDHSFESLTNISLEDGL